MSALNDVTFSIKDKFSSAPGPRYVVEGDHSGEELRENFLKPNVAECLKNSVKLIIILDGTAGFGTSFLEEAFGGLIRIDKYDHDKLVKLFKFISKEEPYLIDDIYEYMLEAKNEG